VIEQVYLPPGLLHAAIAPCVITTVLGSCVSVCLWDRRRQAGGMNHYLLPKAPAPGERSPRHGDTALDLLLARLETLGSSLDDLDARVYGGASMLGKGLTLAEENVATAYRWLYARAVPVVDEDVLGTSPRRVHFDVGTGIAILKKVGES
jgi:chemotaxis protein CheD